MKTLLVEDDPNDRDLFIEAVRRIGARIELEHAADGVEALQMLQDEDRPLPELIVADLKMPRMDGLELLERLRLHPRTRGLRVTVFTSSNDANDINRCRAAGASGYVQKPVGFQAFIEAVRGMLATPPLEPQPEAKT